MPETVNLVDRTTGQTFGVPAEQVAAYQAQGFRPETDEESIDRTATETFHEQNEGVGGAIASGITGGLSGLTLGGSDLALGALGAGRTLRHLEAEHPYAAGGGQIAGALLPTVLSGGAAAGEEAAGIGARILAHSPAGLASKVGGAIGELGEGAGLAGRVAAGTGGAAAEGALYGGGQYLTETALEDKPLSAAGFVAGMGHGALFAAPIGGAGTLAGATLQRARALFPRSEVSAAAAAGVKEQATSALAQTVRDGDAMVQAAERRLSDIDAGTGIAQTGETATRRAFGAADPQAIADQVTGATARQEMAQALEGYQQARQQFEDWITTEADPELEKALSGLTPGDLQTPALAAPRVPVGEFGAPGARGIKTPEELQRALEDSAPGAIASREDVTGAGGPRALRGGANGTPSGGVPAQEIVQQGLAEQPATAVGKRPAPAATGRIEVSEVGSSQKYEARMPDGSTRPLGSEDAARKLLEEQLPDGFRPAKIETHRPFIIERGLPTNASDVAALDENAIYIAKPSDLAKRDLWGNALKDANRDSILEAWKEGKKLPPLDGYVMPDGRLFIEDGNHRLSAAAQTDREVAIRFRDGTGYQPQHGARPIGDRIRGDESAPREIASDDQFRASGTSASGPVVVRKTGRREMEATLPDGSTRKLDMSERQHDDFLNEMLPPGFKSDGVAVTTSRNFSVQRGVPRSPSDIESNALYTVRPSELAERKVFGNGLETADRSAKQYVDDIESAWKEGKKLDPLTAYVRPDGSIYIEDGNHRLQAAARTDREVAVQFRDGSKYEPQRGVREISGRLRDELPARPTNAATESATPRTNPGRVEGDASRADAELRGHPATDTLTGQLRGMHAKLGAGEDLVEMGEPAREAYRAAKAERTKAAADHFRGKALAAREARATAVAAGETPNPFHEPAGGAEMDAFFAQLRAPKTRDAYVAANIGRAMREEGGSHAAALAKVEREWAERTGGGVSDAHEPEVGDATMARILAKHGLGEPAPAATAAVEPDALAARVLHNESRPAAIAPTTPVSDAAVAGGGELAPPMTKAEIAEQRARFRAIAPEQRAAKAIMRHNGKNADMGPRLAREAKVIGDMEQANARLADALGSEAPPTAVTSAKAFHEATAKAQERSAASSAKLGADLQNKVPAMTGGTDATVVDDDVAKALRKHESRAAARADKTSASPAPEMPTQGGGMPAGGIGGKAADLGSALEVMRAIGMHVPAVSHIPVIGPILGLWLKARAVVGIIGRKGGSIGKSTEGLIASKAAAVQDRIVAATAALLESGARAAGKASHLAGPAVLLAGALFPGGEKPKGDRPRDLFEARSNDITRAMQPGAVDQAIAQRFPTSDPAMHDAIVAQVQRGIAFLDSKRPKQTVLPGVLPGDGTWAPSAAAIEEFGKYVHAVNDPVSVLEDLAKGHPSAEGAETLRVVYPELYGYAQKQLLAAAPEMANTLPYPRRVMLSILYQIPVDGTMQPSHAQYLQIPAPPAAAPKAPATSGPLRLGQQTMSPLDQRAAGA